MTPGSAQDRSTGVLVVGAGEAGVNLALALRGGGYEPAILVVGNEPDPPYNRPPLSKDFLNSLVTEEDLSLREPQLYREQRIDVLSGTEIVALEVGDAGSGSAETTEGFIHFDRVVLATGARARELPVPGAQLDGVHYLRDLTDARRLRHDLDRAERVVVIGAGFIGLEAAAVVNARGIPVTVVGREERVLERVGSAPLSEYLVAAHESAGVDFVMGAQVSELTGAEGRVTGVRLADGRTLAADLVIAGIGAVPNIELARSIGLTCEGGIVVDRRCRTSNPHVLAIGDCTTTAHPHRPDSLLALESVQSAINQAKVAAMELIGGEEAGENVPWFWSNQASLKIQIAGVSHGYEQAVVRTSEKDSGLTVLYYLDGQLIAGDCVNRPSEFLAIKRALAKNMTIDPSLAVDVATPLKKLVSPRKG
ncbi:NAD(P)/FAD-dependent oxidoreductase [Dietzia sp. PP-33]|uniref:NAD(P)/FAD-dependent oxidoreductase n=1 Tax=Dietzia sp. PP-33 TaxID=2957500 RepID=UPI0029C028C2|nr:FAD-dependent oxidoreductase [Dietzia sp. PP-33]